MVRSKTVHHFSKKNKIFLFFFICDGLWFAFIKKHEKSCDARFFRSKTVHRIFSDFLKKVKKMGKFAFFSLFSLWSRCIFHIFHLIEYRSKCVKIYVKKNSKKKGFHFLKLFFKNENWTFIFVHFWI